MSMLSSVLPAGPFAVLHINAGDGADSVKLGLVTTAILDLETGAGDNDKLVVLKCTAGINSLNDAAGTGDVRIEKGNMIGVIAPMGFGD